MDLSTIVDDLAVAIKRIDERRPRAVNSRSGAAYQPGIGPHPESQAVSLAATEFSTIAPDRYEGKVGLDVSYGIGSRQKCDLCIGEDGMWEWAIEVKMLRVMGDNGKPNDNMLAHILSPYPAHRSALTDCWKLRDSQFAGRKAVVIYGFDYEAFPMDPVIDAFEMLARSNVNLGPKHVAAYADLCHPVHRAGRVFGWELR